MTRKKLILSDDFVVDMKILDRKGTPVFKLRKAKMNTLEEVLEKYFGV